MSNLPKIAAILMSLITAAFVGLWGLGAAYVSGMTCAFSTSGKCQTSTPWEFYGENLQIMVLVPGVIFLVLLG